MTRVEEVPGGWLWIRDGTARPLPGALEELLAAAERLGPERSPVLLASAVTAPDGSLAPGHEPLPVGGHADVAMTTAALRVLPIRAATGGSALVRPGSYERRGGLVWATGGDGFLVPASRAEATRTPSGAKRAAALMLGPGLGAQERLRLALAISERAVRRAAPGRSSPGSRG